MTIIEENTMRSLQRFPRVLEELTEAISKAKSPTFARFVSTIGREIFVNVNKVVRIEQHDSSVKILTDDGCHFEVRETIDEVVAELKGE